MIDKKKNINWKSKKNIKYKNWRNPKIWKKRKKFISRYKNRARNKN